ncbi:MAG: ABC transporter permease [Microthrixaceae bacterium]
MPDATTLTPGAVGGADSDLAAELPDAAKKQGLGLGAWLSIGWLAFITLTSILAPLFLPDPEAVDPLVARKGPSGAAWLGYDATGRDILSRVVNGAKWTLLIALGAVLIGVVIGGLLGLIAGYFRGWMDAVLSPGFNIMLAFPQLVLALLLVSVFANGPEDSVGKRIFVLIVALGIIAIPLLARITRANTMVWADRDFVLAARAMGAKPWRILMRDVLPNVVPAMMAITLLAVGVAVVAEAGLAFLALGVKLPTPSWGNIMAEGKLELRRVPMMVIAPTLCIFLTVMSLNFLGDVIQKRFNVRESLL